MNSIVKSAMLIFPFIIISCRSYYYMPTQQQIPLFSEKHELQMTGGVDGYNFKNFQFSYAITNSICVQLNTLYKDGNKRTTNYANLIEGGPGYYYNINKYFVIETFAGFGKADINKYNDAEHLSFNRFYIYPILGFHSKFVDLAYSIRYSYLTYHFQGLPPTYSGTQTNFSNMQANLWEPFSLNNNTYDFWEPALTLRLGYKYIKLQGQYNWLVGRNRYNLNYVENNMSVSLFFAFPLDRIFLKNDKK